MRDDKLAELLELAKSVEMTEQEQEAQRRSFAYGNTRIENRDMTREDIENAVSVVAADEGK